jgi:hypothetical protein
MCGLLNTEGIPSRSSSSVAVACEPLKLRKNNRITITRRQQQIEMAVEVSLDLMIDFLERIVIPSFGQPPPFTEGTTREGWMTKRFQTGHIFRELSGEYLEELLILFGTITAEEEANEKLKELEKKQLLQGLHFPSLELTLSSVFLKNCQLPLKRFGRMVLGISILPEEIQLNQIPHIHPLIMISRNSTRKTSRWLKRCRIAKILYKVCFSRQ